MRCIVFWGVAAAALTVVALQPAAVEASTISAAFSSTDTSGASGPGILGVDNTDTWNVLRNVGTGNINNFSATFSDLVDIGNVATTVDFTATDFASHNPASLGLDNVSGTLAPWENSWFADQRTVESSSFTFAGLTPGAVVNLVLFGSYHAPPGNGLNFSRDTDYTVDAVTKTTTGSNVMPAAYTEGETFVRYDGLTVGGTGEIIVSVDHVDPNEFIDVAGFQLTIVPEPGSVALLLIGCLGLPAMVRRRQD